MFSRSQDRFKKLARNLDALANEDSRRLQREWEIQQLRRRAASELHALCSGFIDSMNQLVSSVRLDLSPEDFAPEAFQDPGMNIFQINVSGRVVQLTFQSTDLMESTLELRTPYTLEGSIRWFNQEMLERDDVKDHRLYYCLDKARNEWRFHDRRGNRLGVVDQEYLAAILEELV